MATTARKHLNRALKLFEIPDCKCSFKPLDCGCGPAKEEATAKLREVKGELVLATMVEDWEAIEDLRVEIECLKACIEYYGDCDCPTIPPPPCSHIRAKFRPGLSVEEWWEMLWRAFPSVYRDPPPPRRRTNVMSQTARVEILLGRRRLGYRLWHDKDLGADGRELGDKQGRALVVGPCLVNARNGRPRKEAVTIRIMRNREADDGQRDSSGQRADSA